MAEEREIKQAQAAYETLCAMLDERGWNYDKDDDRLLITCGARGEDLPIDVRMQVDADRMLVTLLSQLSISVPEDKRVDVSLAVSAINYALINGSFDYNVMDGTLLFRLTSSFRESLLGKDMFEYMLYVSCKTVDDYNDKLLMIVKNMMSLDELMKFIDE